MEAKNGEIWEIEKLRGDTVEAVVIAAHERCATVLQLVDTQDGNNFEINALNTKWTSTEKLMYAFDSKFVRFVKKMKDEEYAALMDAVANTLGIMPKTVEKIVEVEKEVPVQIPEQQVIAPTSLDIARVKGERDAYKNMYEGVLKILTNQKAGVE